jgi:hypothetical protein
MIGLRRRHAGDGGAGFLSSGGGTYAISLKATHHFGHSLIYAKLGDVAIYWWLGAMGDLFRDEIEFKGKTGASI